MSVYFATIREQNVVKIGCSFEPESRLKEIQVGCPYPVRIEATLPGSHEEEKALHRRFADDRLRGEWFTITPMIDAVMAAARRAEAERPKVAQIDPPGCSPCARARPTHKTRQEMSVETMARRYLAKQEAAGDIHFPYRTKVSA